MTVTITRFMSRQEVAAALEGPVRVLYSTGPNLVDPRTAIVARGDIAIILDELERRDAYSRAYAADAQRITALLGEITEALRAEVMGVEPTDCYGQGYRRCRRAAHSKFRGHDYCRQHLDMAIEHVARKELAEREHARLDRGEETEDEKILTAHRMARRDDAMHGMRRP